MLSDAMQRHMNDLVKIHTTHGMTKTRIYKCWIHMKDRCYNHKNKQFHNYGGRGITVCDSWLNSFENFLSDMGDMPKGLSLERIDNSKGYSPDNCRWATAKEQAQNRTTTIVYEGKTITEWSKILGISRAAIYARISRNWPSARVLSSKLDNRGARNA